MLILLLNRPFSSLLSLLHRPSFWSLKFGVWDLGSGKCTCFVTPCNLGGLIPFTIWILQLLGKLDMLQWITTDITIHLCTTSGTPFPILRMNVREWTYKIRNGD